MNSLLYWNSHKTLGIKGHPSSKMPHFFPETAQVLTCCHFVLLPYHTMLPFLFFPSFVLIQVSGVMGDGGYISSYYSALGPGRGPSRMAP